MINHIQLIVIIFIIIMITLNLMVI